MSPNHPSPSVRDEARALVRLAAPLALAQLAQVAMGATDTVLLGTLGQHALAAGGLGANLFFTLMIIVSGGLIPVSIIVSHARGAGQPDRIAEALRAGMALAALISIPPMVLLWNAEPILLAIGEPAELASSIASYLRVLLFAMPASMFLATQRAFLAAIGRPWMMMVVTIAAALVNGLLNYGLIHGVWGLPRLGYIGSCTATLITLWAMTAAVALKMRLVPGLRSYRLFGRTSWSIVRELASLGWPISTMVAVEILLFSAAALIVGQFGSAQLAAHQIGMSVSSVTFMVPLSISQAVNVRVGFHMGQGVPRAVRTAARVALGIGVLFMALMGLLMVTLPRAIAGLYITTGDPSRDSVIAIAAQLLAIAAAFQVFDGAQTIAAGALRGIKDTRTPALVAAVGYWGIGFVLAWVLGVRLGQGVVGIWWGLAAGLATVALLLNLRFHRLSGRLLEVSAS